MSPNLNCSDLGAFLCGDLKFVLSYTTYFQTSSLSVMLRFTARSTEHEREWLCWQPMLRFKRQVTTLSPCFFLSVVWLYPYRTNLADRCLYFRLRKYISSHWVKWLNSGRSLSLILYYIPLFQMESNRNSGFHKASSKKPIQLCMYPATYISAEGNKLPLWMMHYI